LAGETTAPTVSYTTDWDTTFGQAFHGGGAHRNGSGVSILGVPQSNRASDRIDVLPTERQDFAAPHPAVDCELNDLGDEGIALVRQGDPESFQFLWADPAIP
jgi:cell division septation protein DedD